MKAKSPPYWALARDALAASDKTLAKIIAERPDMQMQSRGGAFVTLARAIVGQQISVKAANSVWGKVKTCVGPMTPANLLKQKPVALRACGLSEKKVEYMRDLAEHFADGRLKPRAFAKTSDQAIINALVDVKGIGVWSAEMFLMFHLMRPDIWPLGDLGLRNALDKAYGKGRALDKTKQLKIGERFKPWRTVACWYLWRSIEPVPDDY